MYPPTHPGLLDPPLSYTKFFAGGIFKATRCRVSANPKNLPYIFSYVPQNACKTKTLVEKHLWRISFCQLKVTSHSQLISFKTTFQVLLAWHLKRGTGVVVKSATEKRIKENFGCLKLNLDADDMDKIKGISTRFRRCKLSWGMKVSEKVEDLWDGEILG